MVTGLLDSCRALRAPAHFIPPCLYPVYTLPIRRPSQRIYIFKKNYTTVYIYIFIFLQYFTRFIRTQSRKNKLNAVVYTCLVSSSRQVCPVCLGPSLWPAYTYPIRHPCQQIYFFLILYRSVYIHFFVDNILPCISILSYKKINAAVYTCPDYLRYHARWEPSPTNMYI